MKCPYLSASRANTYEACPLRYYAHYELGVRGPSSIPIDSGLLCHIALEHYFTPENTKTGQECFDIAKAEHACADQAEFQEAKKMFFDFINVHPKKDNIIGSEVKLTIDFDSGAKALGYIDRMDMIDHETIRLIDYKTGNFVPSYSELEDAHQTNLYALWVYLKFPEINHVMFTYYYTRHGEQKDIYVSKKQAFAYQEYFEHIYHAIVKNDKPEARLNFFCSNCPYKGKCSEYKNLMNGLMDEKTVKIMLEGKEVNAIEAKGSSFESLAKTYELLGIAQRQADQDKKQLGKQLTYALQYNAMAGATVGDKIVSMTTRKNKKCNKMTIRRIAKKYDVVDEVLKTVSLKDLERALRSSAEGLKELEESTRVEQSAPFPVFRKSKKKEIFE